MTRFDRIKNWYSTKHLFGSWYFVRFYSYTARKFSLWLLLNSKKYQQEIEATVPKGEFRLNK